MSRKRIALFLGSALLLVAGLTLGLRLTNPNSRGRLADRIRDMPIYYRPPTVPMGDGLFRRPGPQKWEGRVIAAAMRSTIGHVGPYGDHPVVQIVFDSLGFRNDADLADWEIVFVGDAFTDLGFLPRDALFSSIVAQSFGWRAKNLGVGVTGTLTHKAYFDRFGVSPGTREAILVFFEGNDLAEMGREAERMAAASSRVGAVSAGAGAPKSESASEDGGFGRSVVGFAKGAFAAGLRLIRRDPVENAIFTCGGQETPVSLAYNPPAPAAVPSNVRILFEETLAQWSREARLHGVRLWLLYMPTKHRVLHGHLRYLPSGTQFEGWQPNDLPAYIGKVADESEIEFVDPTAALVSAAAECRLPYNSVWDTHLNREGSRIVGDLLAQEMARRTQRTSGPAGGGVADGL